MQVLTLEHYVGYYSKDTKADALLDDLKLYEIKRSAIALEPKTICRHLTAIFQEGNAPREENHSKQGPLRGYACLLQFKMPIPSKCHKDIA